MQPSSRLSGSIPAFASSGAAASPHAMMQRRPALSLEGATPVEVETAAEEAGFTAKAPIEPRFLAGADTGRRFNPVRTSGARDEARRGPLRPPERPPTLASMSIVIGLTGGIGSGKSTVARMLAELGAVVIDADAIVHELQAPGMPMLNELARAFGAGILDASGALDRKALADLVFRDAEARARLNAIVHPPVGAEFARRLAAARAAGAPLVVLDIPLLFESRASERGSAAGREVQATVLVWVPESVQIERQMARDGCRRDEALRRIRAQLPLDAKRALADHVIDNAGTREQTLRQVRSLYEALTSGERASPA